MIDRLASVPVHVLAYGLEPDEGALPAPVLYGSIFPAVWSFQLALRSRGLGTTPLYVADEPAIAALVGAPPTACSQACCRWRTSPATRSNPRPAPTRRSRLVGALAAPTEPARRGHAGRAIASA